MKAGKTSVFPEFFNTCGVLVVGFFILNRRQVDEKQRVWATQVQTNMAACLLVPTLRSQSWRLKEKALRCCVCAFSTSQDGLGGRKRGRKEANGCTCLAKLSPHLSTQSNKNSASLCCVYYCCTIRISTTHNVQTREKWGVRLLPRFNVKQLVI